MKVYLVMTLVDDEYGGREVYGVFSSKEKAKAAIKKEGQSVVETWYGSEKQFTIESHEVE